MNNYNFTIKLLAILTDLDAYENILDDKQVYQSEYKEDVQQINDCISNTVTEFFQKIDILEKFKNMYNTKSLYMPVINELWGEIDARSVKITQDEQQLLITTLLGFKSDYSKFIEKLPPFKNV